MKMEDSFEDFDVLPLKLKKRLLKENVQQSSKKKPLTENTSCGNSKVLSPETGIVSMKKEKAIQTIVKCQEDC